MSIPTAFDPEALGYEEALDIGVLALEEGAPLAAVPYLERAVRARSTQYALVRLGQVLRNLGRLDEARARYEEALALPEDQKGFAHVGLAAVLCDLRDYEAALPVASEAVSRDPSNPAALNVAARCCRELLVLLEREGAEAMYVEAVRSRTKQFEAQAAQADPVPAAERLRLRRERAARLTGIRIPSEVRIAPLDQPARQVRPAVTDGAIVQREDEQGERTRAVADLPRRSLLQRLRRLLSASGWRKTAQLR
jgi:tetratricopeptide (TPR) repeat protein